MRRLSEEEAARPATCGDLAGLRTAMTHVVYGSFVIIVLVLAAFFIQNYSSRVNTVHNQRRACERGKIDRTVIAEALRGQAIYLNQVLGAASVKQDVKRAAKKNQRTQNAAATSLESRTGKRLVCKVVYPDASLIPWG